MVVAGRVTLEEVRGINRLVRDELQYKTGLFFGADMLLYSRTRRWIATAVTPAQLLCIAAPDLKVLLRDIRISSRVCYLPSRCSTGCAVNLSSGLRMTSLCT